MKVGVRRTTLLVLLIIFIALALAFDLVLLNSVRSAEISSLIESARRIIQTVQLEIELEVTRAYEAARVLAFRPSLVSWFEGDEQFADAVVDSSLALIEEAGFDTVFFANGSNRRLYVNGEVIDVLSPEDPDDSWFFDFLESGTDISVNVDFNQELSTTLIWVNAGVKSSDGETIGVTGFGITVNLFNSRLARIPAGESGEIYLTDASGVIRLSTNYTEGLEVTDVIPDEARSLLQSDLRDDLDIRRSDVLFIEVRNDLNDVSIFLELHVSDFITPNINRLLFSSAFSILVIVLLILLFIYIVRELSRAVDHQVKSHEITYNAMSMLADLRDNETGAHILRTREYCGMLASELRNNKEYRRYITDEYISDLKRSAPLHDIGKVGIPDHILRKVGKLTMEEFEIMKTHTILGEQVLKNAISMVHFEGYYTIAVHLIRHHHEKWDGSGYPDALSGKDIPLSARIMAVADVYDALRSERSYKKAFTHKDSIRIIEEGSGRHFDPAIVQAFLKLEKEMEASYARTSDENHKTDSAAIPL
jgi:putative two-component system response regulator